jgi:hypothetical protein
MMICPGCYKKIAKKDLLNMCKHENRCQAIREFGLGYVQFLTYEYGAFKIFFIGKPLGLELAKLAGYNVDAD